MLDGKRNSRRHFINAHHAKEMEARKYSSNKKNLNSDYFSTGSFLVLLLVAVSLLLLPLLLPPLPPPPSLLLLVPLVILLLLVVVAFMTSDIRQVTSSYL
jgi:O-antigen/teichoic acid export membrane protein